MLVTYNKTRLSALPCYASSSLPGLYYRSVSVSYEFLGNLNRVYISLAIPIVLFRIK